jgi:hypothetical protein
MVIFFTINSVNAKIVCESAGFAQGNLFHYFMSADTKVTFCENTFAIHNHKHLWRLVFYLEDFGDFIRNRAIRQNIQEVKITLARALD